MDETARNQIIDQLRRRYQALTGAYQKLDDVANAAIVRWRHAMEGAFHLRPAHFQRTNARPGVLVEAEPDADSFYAYGYDRQGRVVYDAHFAFEELPMFSTFYTYLDDRVESAAFHKYAFQDFELEQVAWLMQPAGQPPTHYVEYKVAGVTETAIVETYHFDAAGRLARIEVWQQGGPRANAPTSGGMMDEIQQQMGSLAQMFGMEELLKDTLPQLQEMMSGAGVHRFSSLDEEVFEYEGDSLKRIVAYMREAGGQPPLRPDDEGIVIYRARRKNESHKALIEKGRVSIRQAILDGLATLPAPQRLAQPSYFLTIQYEATGDETLYLVLGADADRQGFERQVPRSSPHWNFEELTSYREGGNVSLDLFDPPEDFAHCFMILRQENRYDAIRRLMQQVAQDLNGHDWSGLLKVTDDFIVYAADYHNYDEDWAIEDDLRACLPTAKLKLWRDKGYVA